MLHREDGTAGSRYYPERLQRKLDLLNVSAAAIIEAPSGYGKTTAMRDYLVKAAGRGDAVHWFSAVDETPTALYRRFCREMEKIDAAAGRRMGDIDFPNAFTVGEACDALRSTRCGKRTWLVLDDFQLFHAALPPPFMAALTDHGVEGLHIIIITQNLGRQYSSAAAGRGILYLTAADLQWGAEDIYKYYRMAGADLTESSAREVECLTGGWVVAVYLQLCSYMETGSFSNEAVFQLVDQLIWNKMSAEQQDFFLMLSPFEACTEKQMCGMLGCGELPGYAMESLSIPFVRHSLEHGLYELHAVMDELLNIKRRERGKAFESECFLRAGDYCRDEGRVYEALAFYARADSYEHILSLDLSGLMYAEIGDHAFYEIAFIISGACPPDVMGKYPLSMLRIAWVIRVMNDIAGFKKLMGVIDGFLPGEGLLRAEWLLLSVYLSYPDLEKMLPALRLAEKMFGGERSLVITPEAPWAFYEYLQLTAFHLKPGAAEAEADMLEEFIAVYAPITGGHGYGADVLYRAELAYFKCETSKAEIYAYKAAYLAENKQQKINQIGAARLLATIALLKSDAEGWRRAVYAIENAVTGPAHNNAIFRALLDVVHGSLLVELRDCDRIAGWMKDSSFLPLGLPGPIIKNALFVYMLYLYWQGEYARLIGFGQTLPIEKFTLISEYVINFFIATGYASLGDRAQASVYIDLDAGKALSDGMIHFFVALSKPLGGLTDEMIEKRYPHLFKQFSEYKEQYIAGWFALRKALVAEDMPMDLTEREREVALLAAEGMHNHEIAEKLYVSENTVRAHLRSVYQKLDIDRRAKLSVKLK